MDQTNLPALIKQTANRLITGITYAEALEIKCDAERLYGRAQQESRLARKHDAYGKLEEVARRVQGDALLILTEAAKLLANEYDAAQERGEVRNNGQRGKAVPEENTFLPATAKDLNLTRKEIHEARLVRDAEKIQPGIVCAAINNCITEGRDPTKSEVRKVVNLVLGKSSPPKKHVDPYYHAMSEIGYACRAIVECAEKHDPSHVIQGFRNEGERHDDIEIIKRAVKFLQSVLEENDRHGENAERNAERRRKDKVVSLAALRKT